MSDPFYNCCIIYVYYKILTFHSTFLQGSGLLRKVGNLSRLLPGNMFRVLSFRSRVSERFYKSECRDEEVDESFTEQNMKRPCQAISFWFTHILSLLSFSSSSGLFPAFRRFIFYSILISTPGANTSIPCSLTTSFKYCIPNQLNFFKLQPPHSAT